VKVSGVVLAMLPEELVASLKDRSHGERGNHPRSPVPPGSQPGDGHRCRLLALGWRGGLVARGRDDPLQRSGEPVAGRRGAAVGSVGRWNVRRFRQ
jgi:hypothetical protein